MGSWGEASGRWPSGTNLTVVFRGSCPPYLSLRGLGDWCGNKQEQVHLNPKGR